MHKMIKSLIWLPLCLSSLSASAFIDDNHDMNFAEQNEIIYNGLIAINTNPAKIKVENKLEAELQYYQTLEYFKYSSNKKYGVNQKCQKKPARIRLYDPEIHQSSIFEFCKNPN